MNTETVDRMLGEYLSNQALVKHLENTASILRKEAANAADVQAEDLIHLTQSWSTDPHGNNVSQPTENAAVKLADGDAERRSKAILAEVERIEKRIETIRDDMRYVEAWLSALNTKEKIVVDCKAIQKLFWRETAVYIEKTFGVAYSAVGLKRIYHRAMEKIYALAGE